MKSSARNSLNLLASLNWSEWKKSLLSCSRIARSSVACSVSFTLLVPSWSFGVDWGRRWFRRRRRAWVVRLITVDPSRRPPASIRRSFAVELQIGAQSIAIRDRRALTRSRPWRSPLGMRDPLRKRRGVTNATYRRHGVHAESLGKVIADAQRVGDRRQPRVDGARGREEAGIDDVQVVEVVRLAVEVERRALGIGAESHRPAVMGDAGEWDLLAEHRPPRNRRAAATEGTEEVLELCQELPVRSGVVVGLGEVDVPLAVDRDAVARVGQVFGGQPEVERVLGDVVEREPRRQPRRADAQDASV